MKIMVVHEGVRDGYNVADAFALAGHDVQLVTSGYGSPFTKFISRVLPIRALEKLARRRCRVVRDQNVSSASLFEVATRALKTIAGQPLVTECIDRSIASRALRLALADSYDVILCYNYNAFRIFSNMHLAKSKKILFQCHPHPKLIREIMGAAMIDGLIPFDIREREFSQSPGYQAMLMAEPLVSDAVLCASSFTKRSLAEAGVPESAITVIPYGISEKFGPGVGVPIRKDGDILNIIFVGQFVYRKGLNTISEILNRVDVPINMTFIGRGNREFDPTSNIRNHLVKCSVHWDVSDEELRQQYSNADVFLFPSLVEGFGHVVLESMRSGCIPVISSSTCGLDVVRQGTDGFVIRPSPNEVDDYLDAIRSLIDPSIRMQMRSSAVSRSQEFTWERFGKQVVSEVERILTNQSPDKPFEQAA